MSFMLTADWCPLGRDTYYRKFEIYSMLWQNEINLDNALLCAASYAGPIAVMRDPKKIVKIQGSGKPVIMIYAASGKMLSSVVWSGGFIVQLGWSSEEELLIIQEDASVFIYDMFGNYQRTFNMGSEAKDTKIIDAKVFMSLNGTGVAVLTSSFRFFMVNSVTDPRIRQVPDVPNLNHRPDCWAVISEDRQTQILVSKSKDLFLLKQSENHALPLSMDPTDKERTIVDIAVSQNNRHVAFFTDNGYIWIGSSDLQKKYIEYDTKMSTNPKQLVWCGTEAVIAHWDSNVLVVGRSGDDINFIYDSNVHLVPEMDGVRVLSKFTHEMIQKVPLAVQQIFRINSTEPGSYLLEASKQFQKRSHRADEYIRLVKEKLHIATQQCIEAAGYEFDTSNQKMLIRAAQFGKGFVPDMNADSYVKMCRILRVLNALREFKIGIPLTYTQLHHLSLQVLLDRLVLRRHYFLAIQISKYLKLPDMQGASRILAHWACFKVKQPQLDKDLVAREIALKLGNTPGVSYTDIAVKAHDSGQTQLAIKLLDYEPRAKFQVPLLLRLGEIQPALVKAIESGDTDLVHSVLLHLRDNMALGDFQLEILRKYPVAQALYLKYCRDHNRETLRDIYYQEDDCNSQAACFLRESCDPKNTMSREASLAAALESYKSARNDFAHSLCEDQLKLLKHQKSLEEKFHREFVGRSLHDMVHLLLMLNEVKLADKLRSEYKVPDRRYWWLRILTLAELEKWVDLEKFANSKKSPIGYEPFVDVCLKHGKKSEAQKYLPKVKDDLKVKYYMKAGCLAEAAQVAFEQKDVQGLLDVQSKCAADRSLADKINVFLAQVSSRK